MTAREYFEWIRDQCLASRSGNAHPPEIDGVALMRALLELEERLHVLEGKEVA